MVETMGEFGSDRALQEGEDFFREEE